MGNVTGGEGLGASFICDSLENSSLVYVYYPSVAVNQTTQEKIIEGTEPDYYVSISRDDFFLKQQYVIDGTATEYDKRLEYDTILKWVIEHKE